MSDRTKNYERLLMFAFTGAALAAVLFPTNQ